MKRNASQSLNCRQKSSKYDIEIDKITIEILDDCKLSKRSGELKDQIEKLLGRIISPDTYSAHLNNLIKERIVIKDDKGRGKEILYSLSEYGTKLKKLKLLRTDEEQEQFREIYANLFFHSILEGQVYCTDDLRQLLKDIGIGSKDLKIERIEKVGDRFIVRDIINETEKQLQFNVGIHYKPIRRVHISETTSYYKNIFYDGFKEDTSYWYTIPGMSLEDFIGRISNFKPKLENLRKAFKLLSNEGLIKPCMEFQGKTCYIFADDALADLIKDLVIFEKAEQELIYYKWSYFHRLSKQELERQKQFFYCKKAFNKLELVRSEMRKEFREIMAQKGPHFKRYIEHEFSEFWYEFYNITFRYLTEKHKATIKKYDFLSEVFKMTCPFLYQNPNYEICDTNIHFDIEKRWLTMCSLLQ